MDTSNTFAVNTGTGCNSYYQSPSIIDPQLDIDSAYSGNVFFTFYDFNPTSSCTPANGVWCEARNYKSITKRDLGQGNDTLSAIANTSTLAVYPNPADATLAIDLGQNEFNELTHIALYNTLGQKVYEKMSTGEGVTKMSSNSLPDGNYLLYISRGNQTWSNQVVVSHK
jgi:hypothetical protein